MLDLVVHHTPDLSWITLKLLVGSCPYTARNCEVADAKGRVTGYALSFKLD